MNAMLSVSQLRHPAVWPGNSADVRKFGQGEAAHTKYKRVKLGGGQD